MCFRVNCQQIPTIQFRNRDMDSFPLFLLLCISLKCVYCIEFFSGSATVIGLSSLAAYSYLKCQYKECCTDQWIAFDESKLIEGMEGKFFGQHLAEISMQKSLKSFFKHKPQKALVMSFNGLTGSGKNFLTNIIANSTYKEGMNSKFVHLYNGMRDFPHKKKVSEYQDRLRKEIVQFTEECNRSLFIFDEVDKMPPGTLDILKPFIEYYDVKEKGLDFTKNIFIFLSNAGSDGIVALTLKFWSEGRQREEISMRDIEPLIGKGAFNENGGFQFSELLRSELIDVFVPFLPLEKKHVRQCIKAELKRRHSFVSESMINEIADQLVYYPAANELYSKSGCKRVVPKIDMLVD